MSENTTLAIVVGLLILVFGGAVLRCQVVTEDVMIECLHAGHPTAECKDIKP